VHTTTSANFRPEQALRNLNLSTLEGVESTRGRKGHPGVLERPYLNRKAWILVIALWSRADKPKQRIPREKKEFESRLRHSPIATTAPFGDLPSFSEKFILGEKKKRSTLNRRAPTRHREDAAWEERVVRTRQFCFRGVAWRTGVDAVKGPVSNGSEKQFVELRR